MTELHHFIRRTNSEKIESRSCYDSLQLKYRNVKKVMIESRIYIETKGRGILTEDDLKIISRILCDDWDSESYFAPNSDFSDQENGILVEIGPRLHFTSPFSTNCVNICLSAGLSYIKRIERARRYKIELEPDVSSDEKNLIISSLYDEMTEQIYETIPLTLSPTHVTENWKQIYIFTDGIDALEKANVELGLGFDKEELLSYYKLFMDMNRNPTSVELFDLAQSNSEHSRHWFFKGKYVVDGIELKKSLMELVAETNMPYCSNTNDNNIIKFNDNSSGIKGFEIKTLRMTYPVNQSPFEINQVLRHIIFTAETHNFPTGVAPFSGATTGTGGRIRDIQGAGRGGRVIAGTAGYCFGNLCIPGYSMPWEPEYIYPTSFASPLDIAIEASNGASDYGNKFGEPVITGFARSFGMTINFDNTNHEERREWIKPIMFSGGIGGLDEGLIHKEPAQPDDYIVKIGGPAYRIGVGGGAASSTQVQGDGSSDRDLLAVQRGDAEMEQKMNRLLISCMELNEGNPVRSIHDQGAGGNANVLKELIEDIGGVIFTKSFTLGDPTMSVLEIWGAEYQENNAVLVKPQCMETLINIARREKCPIDKVGFIANTGKVQLVEEEYKENINLEALENLPVDLNLKSVFSGMPRKTFHWTNDHQSHLPATIKENLSIKEALERVLRLPSVASKRYLTNKVDRSVSGLVAQQQCCGPSHMPVADVAVVSLGHFSKMGAATSIGEQPIKMLINPEAGARLSVIEALTNLCSAYITDIKDIKCSANWMWPAKLPGEGYKLYRACDAMCEIMKKFGVAVDGGKDSLSMAARIRSNDSHGEVVKAPGSLVISAYAPCSDIEKVVTPDLKICNEDTVLLLVKPSLKSRIGGSTLAQVFNQLGCDVPDFTEEEVIDFVTSFNILQNMIRGGDILAMHDISDGGLLTCVLEMAMAGSMGMEITLPKANYESRDNVSNVIASAFNEEPGWVIQIKSDKIDLKDQFPPGIVSIIGHPTKPSVNEKVTIYYEEENVCSIELKNIIKLYEETSYQIEKLQMNPHCAEEEFENLQRNSRSAYKFKDPINTEVSLSRELLLPKVAVVREEGTNGDREMAAAFMQAGFDVYDVVMTDIISGRSVFQQFQGLIFPGGFSYADVLGSAAGWAVTFKEQPQIMESLKSWRDLPNTFSLGVCNGCQLMARLGWIGNEQNDGQQHIRILPNVSGRFESRWSRLKIRKTNSIFFQNMETSILGCWVAHGEGRFDYKEPELLKNIIDCNLNAVEYVDPNDEPTIKYPFNPNGSQYGIAGIASPNGRHLAMMPHPERAFMTWQWPDQRSTLPWKSTLSPWIVMFQNAFNWCRDN